MHIPLLLALLPAALAAPLLKAKPADVIAGKYIVKLKEDMSPNSAEMLMTSMAAAPDHKYSMSGFRGWAGALSDEELTRLQASDQVHPFHSRRRKAKLTNTSGRMDRRRFKSICLEHRRAEERYLGS